MRINYKLLSLLLFSLFFINKIFSQEIAIGQWRDHLPWNSCISVTEGDGIVYCATKYAVFSFDKSDNSLSRMTKVNYLSDIGVSKIAYHKALKTLVVAYSNGNLDLIENGVVTNISDIKRKQLQGYKSINNILFIGNYAYLSCGFGIVVVDLEKQEIKDTYYIGPNGTQINVLDMTFDGTKLYAATEAGVYDANISDPDLSDYSVWTKHTEMPHPDGKFNAIEYFNHKIFVNYSTTGYYTDTIFAYNDTAWTYFSYPATCYNIRSFGNNLVVTNVDCINFFDTSGVITSRIYTYSWPNNPAAPAPRDAIIDKDQNNVIWIADANVGLVKNAGIWTSTSFQLNGPKTANVFKMSVENSNLWVAPGGMDATWNNVYNSDGVFSFINETWTTYDKDSISGVNKHIYIPALKSKNDIVSIAVNPSNPSNVFAGSWSKGLLEFNNQSLTTVYDTTNSTLQWNYRIGIAGIVFDENDNMWVTNTAVNKALHIRKASNKQWTAFDFNGYINTNAVGDLAIDKDDQKWMILPRGNGLLVFNDNKTIDDPSDDKIKLLSTSIGNGALPSDNIYSIAVGQDGEVWVGTDLGIAVFYNPENVFSGSGFDSQQILVNLDGYIQPLLASEVVTAISVDGANRKWIGTQKAGVFLMSADGTTQLQHFTEDNSPLFSNTINCIAIDQKTGEIFFGTDKGIVSYKGDSTAPDSSYTNILVYPNPVTENYNGLIAIKGLVGNADIKITDITGTLIYQTTAKGGEATWNGKNFSGERAKTGVYLVFCSNSDGSKTIVAKIMFIN